MCPCVHWVLQGYVLALEAEMRHLKHKFKTLEEHLEVSEPWKTPSSCAGAQPGVPASADAAGESLSSGTAAELRQTCRPEPSGARSGGCPFPCRWDHARARLPSEPWVWSVWTQPPSPRGLPVAMKWLPQWLSSVPIDFFRVPCGVRLLGLHGRP